jgi:FMN phosphatase YigB (HAD superfamily)
VKEIILFDIDYTLLDTAVSKRYYREKISKLANVSIDDFILVENEYKEKDSGFTDFHPDDYIDHVCKFYNLNENSVRELFFNNDNFKDALYDDVVPTLEVLSGRFILGIFSEGFEDFQLAKLHKSGIMHFFEKELTFIFRRKLEKSSLSLLPTKCFVVDDNPSVVEALAKIDSFKTFWLNRKSNEKDPVCTTIHGLKELNSLI